MTRAGVDRVIVIGYLADDPERRALADGGVMVNCELVTVEVWWDRQSGEERFHEERHRVAIFNEPLGNIAMQYLERGAWMYFCGMLRTRKWVDAAGVQQDTSEIVLPRYSGELQMLDRRGDSSQ
jgi:single-strand DNA-binding protein